MMAKTCRTCERLVVRTWCPWRDIYAAHVDADGSYGCYKPRETPLLVDALGEALRTLVGLIDSVHLEHRLACTGHEWDVAMHTAVMALTKHKEEVGDA